jgi:hypothetical protein
MQRMLVLLLIPLMMFAPGCGVGEKSKDETNDFVASRTCESPPESFTWDNKEFVLRKIGDRELEPGKKWGY